MKSIGLDLDGVLYPWHIAVYDYYNRFKGFAGTFNEFWTSKWKTMTEEDWKFILEIDIFYSSEFPTEDCKNFLDKIKDRFNIYYITSRPDCVKLTTEQYLRRFKFPFQDNLIFATDKVNMTRLLQLSYFVEDRPEYIESLSKITKTFMVAQPWNREYWDKYTTVHSLSSILNYLED